MLSPAAQSRKVLRFPAVALVATVLAWAAHFFFWPLDAFLNDVGTTNAQVQARDDFALLNIDEAFMAGHHTTVTPRDRLAKVVDAVSAAKARAIVVDVWLDSRFEKHSDALLRKALLNAKKGGVPVFLSDVPLDQTAADKLMGGEGARTGTTAHASTIPYFRDAAAGAGNVLFVLDADGKARAISPSPHLNAMAWLAAYPEPTESLRVQKLAQRVRSEPVPIAWNHTITETPAMAIVQLPQLAALLEGKTVFIGATYPRSQDFFQTPRDWVQRHRLYGVQLLAHAAATLRDGAPRHSSDSPSASLSVLILAFGLALVAVPMAWHGAATGIGVAVLGVAGALALGTVSAREVIPLLANRYWPPSLPLLSVLFSCGLAIALRSREQARELKLVRDTFGAYVGDEVLQALGNRMPEMGGEIRKIAVLFCDIRGYSALAERMQNDPAKLMNALNEHFEPLVEALKARGAYADNYVGDLVMALCGAPVSQGYVTDVQNAVAAANDFVRLVEDRNVLRRAAGEEPIEVGIGLHCGEAVVGNLGSKRKIHYTAIGDVVNIASRVESSTRKYGVPLLVTEEIVQIGGGHWEFVEETTVKGREAPVRLYRAADQTSADQIPAEQSPS